MGQNKKQTQKAKEAAGGKGLLGPVIAIAVMFGLIFGAMIYSQPSGELEAYKRGDSTEPASAVSNQGQTEPASTPSADSNSANKEDGSASSNESAEKTRRVMPDPKVVKAAETPDPSFPKVSRQALVHLDQAIKLVEEGKFNTAELEFEKAEMLSPEAPEIQAIWASALKLQKKFKGADRRFAKADELAPNDAEILFNWGMLKLEDKDAGAAIELFEKTIDLDPDNFMVYNYLGKALGQRKQYVRETKMYEKSLELKPDFAQAHFNIAVVLSLQNKVDEAAPHFERAIELDKEFEKPFVVDMLKAIGRYKGPKVSKEARDKAPVATAKLTPSDEKKKSEGSGHKMEGSNSKEMGPSTDVKGKVLVNKESIGPGAIVFLETKTKLKVPGQAVQELKIAQENLQFSPAHSVVQVGSTVVFANEDKEVHNIFSKSLNNQFNLGAMARGSSKSLRFTQPGPVILRCNLHKDMIGTVFVVPNGYYTQTNEAGEYEFRDLVNQEYLFQVWHPRLYPEEVGRQMKSQKLNGADLDYDFAIASSSKAGEVHDLVDDVDYRAIADVIEKEVFQAIADWKAGKKYLSRKRMLMAITKHFDGMGLKGAITKSFSEKRGLSLEGQLDVIRKKISGLGKYKEGVTEEGLKSETRLVMSQIRNSIQELEARLKLSPDQKK